MNSSFDSQSELQHEEEEDEERCWEDGTAEEGKGFGKRAEDSSANRRVRLEPEALSKQGDFRTGFVATGMLHHPCLLAVEVGALAGVVSMEALSIAHQTASALQILQENAHRLQVYSCTQHTPTHSQSQSLSYVFLTAKPHLNKVLLQDWYMLWVGSKVVYIADALCYRHGSLQSLTQFDRVSLLLL